MNVRFKPNDLLRSGVVYKVLEPNIVAFDEVLEKYTMCHKIEILGDVSTDMLEECIGEPNAVDVGARLTNIIDLVIREVSQQ